MSRWNKTNVLIVTKNFHKLCNEVQLHLNFTVWILNIGNDKFKFIVVLLEFTKAFTNKNVQ